MMRSRQRVSYAMCATSRAATSRRLFCPKPPARGLASQRVSTAVNGLCMPLNSLGTFTIQVLLDHIHDPANAHLLSAFPKAVRGIPGKEVPPQNWFDCSRSLKVLDMKPTDEGRTA